MFIRIDCKGATTRVAPFALWLLLFCLPAHTLAAACPAQAISERVSVVHVYDGDTVKLTDGRRLRLIGINTPELRRDQHSVEQFAEEAHSALQAMLDRSNRTLLLQYGQEQQDHYGRLLAHAFLDNGDNAGARLLQAGLATALVVPPNTRLQACYQRQEDLARSARLGLWAHPRYQVQDSRTLPATTRGFALVHGTLQRISRAGGTVWLQLDGPLSLRIARQDQVNFPAGFHERMAGQTVEVRGWVRSRSDGRLQMTLSHPAALQTITTRMP